MSAQTNIDLDHLEKYVAGDNALRDEILTIYSEQAELMDEKFQSSQTDEGWKNTAHALKGASRGVGAWALGDLCEEAEALVGQIPGKMEKRAALLVSIRRAILAAVTESRQIRDST